MTIGNGATVSPLAAAALDYVGRGFQVFPVHEPHGNDCSCGKVECKSPAKHPRTRNGLVDATSDPATVSDWWSRWPAASIGIRTGAESGFVVLDIDPRHGGEASLAELIRQHGPLSETVEAETGGGGRHYLFRHPGHPVKSRNGVAPGIDVKADGGYIVAAPSMHISGIPYLWAHGRAPGDVEFAELPGWLLPLLADRTRHNGSTATATADGDIIEVGKRNSTLTSLAGTMRRRGMTADEIEAALQRANANRCSPPLSPDEVTTIAQSVGRYAPDQPGDGNGFTKNTGKQANPLPLPPETVWKPFPVSAFPEPIRGFVAAASRAIGCDASYIALPMLACLARAVGNKRVIRLKRTWTEPAVVWGVIVGKSGTHKTPALEAATVELRRLQNESIAGHADEMQQFQQDLQLYERAYADWKRKKGNDEPPPWKPDEPVCQRYLTTDCTVEALASLLSQQDDGLVVVRDELAGWLGGIAEYKGGKGSDLGHWLSMWSASPLTVDRKTGAIKMVHVPRAAVSIVGGIQPGVLRSAIGREHMQDGLCARLLLTMPPSRPVRWSEAIVDPQVEGTVRDVFARLLAVEAAADEQGNPMPFPLSMTAEAKQVWIDYYNSHRAEMADLDNDLAAAWSKMEAYTARFALIFQMVAWAAGETSGDEIDQTSMEAAIVLSNWFGNEAKRVYAVLNETEGEQEARELVELIERKGGRITVRDLMQSCRRFRKDAEIAEAALNRLAEAGWGSWVIVSTATNKRREFHLSLPGNGNTFAENGGAT